MCARNSGFFYRYRVPFKVIGVLLLIVLGLSFAYFLSMLGPQRVDEDDLASMNLNQEEIYAMVDESEKLRAQYDEMVLLREPTKEDIDLLRQSVEILQQALQAADGSDRRVRESLEVAREVYHNEAAKGLKEESIAFERKINDLPEDDDDGRIELYNQAIVLQEQINDLYPLSKSRDPRRLGRLERERDGIKAMPLYKETLQSEKEANNAMENGDWAEADKALRKAIAVQKLLNAKYRSLQYADLGRLSRLERDLVSLESARLYDRVVENEEIGKKALEEGKYRESAAAYVKARRAQEELNREYPGSRFASLPRVEEFHGMQETALGTELSSQILTRMKELDASLKARKVWDAAGQIQSLSQQIEQFSATYPRNTMVGEQEKRKIAFLFHVQNDLALLQDRIYGQLLPIPGGETGWHLARTEVPQALFSSIMLNNPSRNRGELYPVDSITWDEAKEFCQKVSWLLGRPVRLPTQNEFLESIGKLRYVDLNTISWNQQNSDGITHEVATKEANSAGYHDLLGNVAEWLESTGLPGDSEAYLAGGSADTSIDSLADKPVEIVNRRTRNRMNGFRIAVQMTE